MGQEILYCNKCGKRLVGDDFTRGRAHTFNNRQYCTACVPQEHTGAHKAIREDEKRKTGTGRRVQPKPPTTRATAPPPRKSPLVPLVAAGLVLAAVGGVVAVVKSGTADPAPEALRQKPPPVANPAVPAGPTREKLAQDLKELEPKVQKLTAGEQFAAAIDLLEEARKRYATPEWTQAIEKRAKEVHAIPTGLYPSLKERATAAQLLGAKTEVQQERARVATWGRKDLLEDLDKAVAAVIPKEPLPAGAKVLIGWPKGGDARYNLLGTHRDGALAGTPFYGNCVMVGWESGLEIIKIPEEGEVRVVYSTNSPKPITLVLRAFGPDKKNHPYNFFIQKPEPGRPQGFKIPAKVLKDWNNVPILPGAVVDNIYLRQDDVAAVFKVHEFVIFATKP